MKLQEKPGYFHKEPRMASAKSDRAAFEERL